MDKLRIAICDRDPAEAENERKLCRSVCAKTGEQPAFRLYEDGAELLSDMRNGVFASSRSVLIVDPERGFAEVPLAARRNGYGGLILYLSHSTSVEYYSQAFEARAFNYVVKGADSQSAAHFRAVFERALDEVRQMERQQLTVSYAGERRKIDLKDIYFFETAMDHLIRVEYDGGSFKFVSTLQELERNLRGRGFLRAHRSYLVSLDAVSRLSASELTLRNGYKIPVSRSALPILKSAIDYWEP